MRRRMIAVGGALVVALALAVSATLAFPKPQTATTPKAVALPAELQELVFEACLPGLFSDSGSSTRVSVGPATGALVADQGLRFTVGGSPDALSVGIEAPGDWAVTVTHDGATVQNRRPSADQSQLDSVTDQAVPAAQSLYKCMAPYRFDDYPAETLSSRAQLLQLYRYDAVVLWPCLKSHGLDVGNPPSRDQFVTASSGVTTNPLSATPMSRKMLLRLVPALRACPLRPAYLG
ncbi:MAG: hypothetical protein ABIS08_11330 [Pseudolysinimonas sp.]